MVIKEKLLIKLLETAPKPKNTKIIGKAQQNKVENDVNKASIVIMKLFCFIILSNNFHYRIAIINNDISNLLVTNMLFFGQDNLHIFCF